MDFKNLKINNTVLAKANLNLIYFNHPPAKAGGNSAKEGGNSTGENSTGENSTGGNSTGGNSTGENSNLETNKNCSYSLNYPHFQIGEY